MDDMRIMQKFLRVIPSRFAQVPVSIDTFLDLRERSIKELTCRLRVVEDRFEDGCEKSGDGCLQLSEWEWERRK